MLLYDMENVEFAMMSLNMVRANSFCFLYKPLDTDFNRAIVDDLCKGQMFYLMQRRHS